MRERFKAKMIPPAVSRASACRSEASFAIVCEGFEASRAVDTLLVIAWGGPPFEGYMARKSDSFSNRADFHHFGLQFDGFARGSPKPSCLITTA